GGRARGSSPRRRAAHEGRHDRPLGRRRLQAQARRRGSRRRHPRRDPCAGPRLGIRCRTRGARRVRVRRPASAGAADSPRRPLVGRPRCIARRGTESGHGCAGRVPELPEVETVRRRLEPVLVGRRFEHVEIDDSRLTRPFDPAEVAAELTGERVEAVERRGKYLVVRFESGRVLLIHLRMTGNVLHAPRGAPVDVSHRRAVVNLDDGSDVVYRDVRRFGTWLLVEPDEVNPYLAARLGGEPIGRTFTSKGLAAKLANRKAPVKAALLDQRTLAGLGNIYVDEALWRARVNPLTPARELGAETVRALRDGIKRALAVGIA